MAHKVSTKYASMLRSGLWEKTMITKDTKPAGNIKKFRIATWNIWFDPYRMEKRMNEIMNIISDNKIDIFCFQEVTQKSFNYLSKHKYFQNCYISSTDMNDIGDYGNTIISKFPISQVNILKYNATNMSRKLVTCGIYINNQFFKICTTHLESLENNRPQRISQLNQSIKYLLANHKKPDHTV